jgi:hypothetical protein
MVAVTSPVTSTWNIDTTLNAQVKVVNVYDSTLRKLLLMPTIKPTLSQILETADQLAEIGVRHVILNVFYNGDVEPNDIEFQVCRELLSRDFGFEVSVSSDAFITPFFLKDTPAASVSHSALQALADLGMTNCAALGVDPRDGDARLALSDEVESVFAWCRSQGIEPVLNVTDVGRYDFEFLVSLTNTAIGAGAVRIDAHDSVSSLTPYGATAFARAYRAALVADTEIVLHSHNDFGLASACATAASVAGLAPDVSLLGVSYRSGLAALEEVCLALEWHHDIDTGIDLGALTRAATDLAARFDFAIPPLKPVVGRQQFLRQLPLWNIPYFNSGEQQPSATAHSPSLVGGAIEVVWNRSRSTSAIRAKARHQGLDPSVDELGRVSADIEAELAQQDMGTPWVDDTLVTALLERHVERRLS